MLDVIQFLSYYILNKGLLKAVKSLTVFIDILFYFWIQMLDVIQFLSFEQRSF